MDMTMRRLATRSIRATLANNVRDLRKLRGLSQEALADLAGLHRTYVGSIERMERNATLSTLEALAGALNVNVGGLLTGRPGVGSSTRAEKRTARVRRQ